MGRAPYRCDCRFNRDDDTVEKVRWFEARPGAPTLGKTSIIYRREWDNDEYQDVTVGELAGAAKKFLPGSVPAGLPGQHLCGSDQDFEEGGHYDPEEPEQRYSASGWPLCCGPPVSVRGGAGASGRVVPVVVDPVVPCPTPTLTCAAAPPGELGAVCLVGPTDINEVWRRWDVIPGEDYRLRMDSTVGATVNIFVYEGSSCSSLTLLDTTSTSIAFYLFDFTASAPHVWVKWVPVSPISSANSQTQLFQTS